MSLAARRRAAARVVLLDRSLEGLPLFRLSDSADDAAISFTAEDGGRWRVLPNPGDRLPGTFDQDVYVELMHRFHEAGEPADGAITFTLHAFLRSMGRQVDGRTYEQLRGALGRLERTTLESLGSYYSSVAGGVVESRFSILSAVTIERNTPGQHALGAGDLEQSIQPASHGRAELQITLHRDGRRVAAGHILPNRG